MKTFNVAVGITAANMTDAENIRHEIVMGLEDARDFSELGMVDLTFEVGEVVEKVPLSTDDVRIADRARNDYGSDDVIFDDEPEVEHVERGAWVSAKVWIAKEGDD